MLRTVSFIQIRRAAHSFSRDSAASATSLCVKRADADLSHVTGQLGWEILLTVCFSRFVVLRGGRGWRRLRHSHGLHGFFFGTLITISKNVGSQLLTQVWCDTISGCVIESTFFEAMFVGSVLFHNFILPQKT